MITRIKKLWRSVTGGVRKRFSRTRKISGPRTPRPPRRTASGPSTFLSSLRRRGAAPSPKAAAAQARGGGLRKRLKGFRPGVPEIATAFLVAALGYQMVTFGRNVIVNATAVSLDWGMSFQKDGQAPVCNSSKEYLAPYDAFYIGDESRKVVYLTFDAGYENGFAPGVLDVLKKRGVKATFFLVGNYFKTQPDLVRRMVEEGHSIGNHTLNHPDMTRLTRAAFQKELDENARLYEETVGEKMPMYYRPPSGKYSEENLAWAKELGYTTVFWSSAYMDWDNDRQPTPEAAFSKLIPRTHPGAVVLLHLTSKTNSQILDEYIGRLSEMGYEFETLDQLKVWSVTPADGQH